MSDKEVMVARLDDWIDKYYHPDEPRPALLKKIRDDVLKEIEMDNNLSQNYYCANCSSEATHFVDHAPDRRTTLCYKCKTAYEWGQASPEPLIAEIDYIEID